MTQSVCNISRFGEIYIRRVVARNAQPLREANNNLRSSQTAREYVDFQHAVNKPFDIQGFIDSQEISPDDLTSGDYPQPNYSLICLACVILSSIINISPSPTHEYMSGYVRQTGLYTQYCQLMLANLCVQYYNHWVCC
jgi:hypothetical protein